MTANIEPLFVEILDEAMDELVDNPPGRAFIQPGAEVSWDDCCQGGGQLSIRLISLVPAGTAAISPCPPAGWTATVGLSLIRCVAGLDDAGRVPTAEQLSADGADVLADMTALERALNCRVRELDSVERMSIIQWLPQGPEGGCAGGEWQFMISVLSCACPETSGA